MTTPESTPRHPEYLSPNQKAWRRFKKNTPALVGMVIIGLAILIAIFGHLLAFDHTPDANEQILEIATQPPGFTITLLKVQKNRPPSQTGAFKLLLSGVESNYKQVPLTGYRFSEDTLFVERYTGQTGFTATDTFQIADVVYALDEQKPIEKNSNTLSFTLYNGQRQQADIAALQQTIQSRHLETRKFLLGTDKFGRDNVSRLILGVRVSLSVGLMAVLISMFIGITLGSAAGYFRGKTDEVVMWLINIFWSIPLLLLVFALVLALGREFWQIYLAVGLTMWIEVARLVRGQILSIREKEFVEAAQSLGFSHFRIITRHILPNIVGPVVVIAAADFANAIIIEAGLSFLGIGVQPPAPSWGTMLNEYYSYIGTSKAFLALAPGVAIMLLVLAFNLMGNGLRDAMDVKTRL
ncbi:ABC transporter permease [Sphingobacteriales bacterium UPWRP_1]|nr:hypothetical protein B6N25_12055 [Sphingobacteriales bacterium TSM_CSS]PSJ77150.1 ABC transporter permease [Sphingobacteriales bacterium UPWRP_1]